MTNQEHIALLWAVESLFVLLDLKMAKVEVIQALRIYNHTLLPGHDNHEELPSDIVIEIPPRF